MPRLPLTADYVLMGQQRVSVAVTEKYLSILDLYLLHSLCPSLITEKKKIKELALCYLTLLLLKKKRDSTVMGELNKKI